MLITMKTRKDVYVDYCGQDMRYSDYIELMWSYGKYEYVTKEEWLEIRKMEDKILKAS